MATLTRNPGARLTQWSIGVLAAAVLTIGGTAAHAGDEQAVGAASAQFYSALNAMFAGDVAPMRDVWSHQDDVTYMGPGGGFDVGWGQVLAVWEKQAAMKLGGNVQPTQTHVTAGSDLAIVSTVEEGENTNAGGKRAKVSIRATNLFRKENGKWKMIGHHTDLLPFLEKPQAIGSAR